MGQTDTVSIIHGDTEVKTTMGTIAALNKGIKLNEIKAAVPELEALCNRKIETAEIFTDLVKLVALKSGVDASVLSTYITACCKDTLNKKQNQAGQLVLLFEELSA